MFRKTFLIPICAVAMLNVPFSSMAGDSVGAVEEKTPVSQEQRDGTPIQVIV